MAFQGFDPSILLGASNPNFISQGIAGFQAGREMARKSQQSDIERTNYLEGIASRENLKRAASMLEGVDPATKEALMADPELYKEWVKQKISSQLKVKNALPDNEWVDDDIEPENYEMYVEKMTDPTTRMPIMRKVPGMRRKKKWIDRIDFEKKKLNVEKDQFERTFTEGKRKFNINNVLDNSKNTLEWAEHKVNKQKAELDIAKKKFDIRSKEAGAKIDYANLERKAVDAMKTIDKMIGSKDGKIKQHEGFETTVGLKGGSLLFGLRSEPFEGSQAANFMTLYNKVTGQAFMEAFQGLKGGGQITEIEGQKATQALIEMNTAQSEDAFIKAARDFQHYVKTGIDLAKQEKSGKLGEQPIAPQAGGMDPVKLKRLQELRRKKQEGTLK